ncbi:hypothetical protein KGY73_02755 [bacterium]|nr:hypothetical protein [bacterium]
MKMNIKRLAPKRWLSFPFYLVLIAGVIFLNSCGGGEQAEEEAPPEPEQEIQKLETQISDLEKELSQKEKTIAQLEKEKADLEEQIPEPNVVQRGDSHWGLAFDFLTTEKNVPAAEARNMLAKSHLLHPIHIGYKVWHYFYGQVYGTFVTQGDAKVSPGTVKRLKEKKIKEEKAKLEKRIADLEKKGEQLRSQIEDLEQDKVELNDQISSLEQDISELKNQKANLESKLNSVYYFVGTREELKAQNKIKGSFLGIIGINVKEVSFADYQNRVDLRKTEVISVSASDVEANTIKKVKLLPKHLEEGIDYRVEIGGQSADIQLLDKNKFHLSRIIIVIN